jgi:hypothetical protein
VRAGAFNSGLGGEGEERGAPGRRRAGAAMEEGEGDWGGRRLKRGLTGGPHLSAGGRERSEVGRRRLYGLKEERPHKRE